MLSKLNDNEDIIVRDSNSSSMERVSVNPTIQFPVVAVVGRL
jgi:hypothetical protein